MSQNRVAGLFYGGSEVTNLGHFRVLSTILCHRRHRVVKRHTIRPNYIKQDF